MSSLAQTSSISDYQARFTKTSFDEIDELSKEWRTLCDQNGRYAEPFFQPEWFLSFARAFEKGHPLHLVTTRQNGLLAGILPLVSCRSFFSRIPARTLRSLSGIHSCRFDLVHREKSPVEPASAMWKTLRDYTGWDVIEALDVPSDGSFMHILAHARNDGFLTSTWPTRKSPYLLLPQNTSDPFQNCPTQFKSYRSRLKSKLRKLEQCGAVTFRSYTTDYQDALTQFFALESSGWKGARGSSIALNLALIRFYSLIAEECARRGTLCMYSLLLDSKPIAMHLGLLMSDSYFAPKVAYDERFAKFSPGQLLVKHVIADLCQRGAHRYDFLGPRAVWKSVWTDRIREHQNCYIFRPGVRGRFLHTFVMRGATLLRRCRHKLRGDPQDLDHQLAPARTQVT